MGESKEHAMHQRDISKADKNLQVFVISIVSAYHYTGTVVGEVWTVPERWRDTRTVVSRNTHVPLPR